MRKPPVSLLSFQEFFSQLMLCCIFMEIYTLSFLWMSDRNYSAAVSFFLKRFSWRSLAVFSSFLYSMGYYGRTKKRNHYV